MDSAQTPEVGEGIRELILTVAERRFRQFGYSKTTMNEIADDAKMSAANIYRYFDSKHEIMAGCARNYSSARLKLLKNAIARHQKNPVKMLEQYVLTNLYYSHRVAVNDPRVLELIEQIKESRPDIVYERIDAEIALIKEILLTGKNTGVFRFEDIEETARGVYMCVVIYDLPVFIGLYPLETLEDMAKTSVRIILSGLTA